MMYSKIAQLAVALVAIPSFASINVNGKFAGEVQHETAGGKKCKVTFSVQQTEKDLAVSQREYVCEKDTVTLTAPAITAKLEPTAMAKGFYVLIDGKKVGMLNDSGLFVKLDAGGASALSLRPSFDWAATYLLRDTTLKGETFLGRITLNVWGDDYANIDATGRYTGTVKVGLASDCKIEFGIKQDAKHIEISNRDYKCGANTMSAPAIAANIEVQDTKTILTINGKRAGEINPQGFFVSIDDAHKRVLGIRQTPDNTKFAMRDMTGNQPVSGTLVKSAGWDDEE